MQTWEWNNVLVVVWDETNLNRFHPSPWQINRDLSTSKNFHGVSWWLDCHALPSNKCHQYWHRHQQHDHDRRRPVSHAHHRESNFTRNFQIFEVYSVHHSAIVAPIKLLHDQNRARSEAFLGKQVAFPLKRSNARLFILSWSHTSMKP